MLYVKKGEHIIRLTRYQYTPKVKREFVLSDVEGKEIYVSFDLEEELNFLNIPYNFKEFVGLSTTRFSNLIFETFKTIEYQDILNCINYVYENFGQCYNYRCDYLNFKKWFNENLWNTNTKDEAIFLFILAGYSSKNTLKRGHYSLKGFYGAWKKKVNLSSKMTENKFNRLKERLNKTKIFDNYIDMLDYLKDFDSSKMFYYKSDNKTSEFERGFLKDFKGTYFIQTKYNHIFSECLNNSKFLFKYFNCEIFLKNSDLKDLALQEICMIIPFDYYEKIKTSCSFRNYLRKFRKSFVDYYKKQSLLLDKEKN